MNLTERPEDSLRRMARENVALTAEVAMLTTEVRRLQNLLAQEARVNLGLLNDIDADAATIERVRALLGDRDGPLWAVRGVREADIRAALDQL